MVAVPSYNESFGLVAAEAQAAGTPVIAAAVGGLSTVVADGVSGLLLDTHEPADWAHAIGRVLVDDGLRARLAAGARTRAGCVLLGGDGRAHPRHLRARAREPPGARLDIAAAGWQGRVMDVTPRNRSLRSRFRGDPE